MEQMKVTFFVVCMSLIATTRGGDGAHVVVDDDDDKANIFLSETVSHTLQFYTTSMIIPLIFIPQQLISCFLFWRDV